MGEAEVLDLLMDSSRTYFLSKVSSNVGSEEFARAFNEAGQFIERRLAMGDQGLTWEPTMSLYLQQASAIHVRSLSWWRRHMYAHYVTAGYDLATDVYESIRRRFVTGGQGEGWIVNLAAARSLTERGK